MAERETIAVSGNDGSRKREQFIDSFIEEKAISKSFMYTRHSV